MRTPTARCYRADKQSLNQRDGYPTAKPRAGIHEKKGFRIKPAGKAVGLPLDSHPQSKKIRALWLEMAAAGVVRDSSEQALALWVKRETGISALRWLSNEQASSVIEKLKKWQRRAAGVKQ